MILWWLISEEYVLTHKNFIKNVGFFNLFFYKYLYYAYLPVILAQMKGFIIGANEI